MVRSGGNASSACDRPACTGNFVTMVHEGWGPGAVTVNRQISAVIGSLALRRSVVVSGVVHCKWTISPVRSAVRSLTISGRFSEGGLGGPGLAQPATKAIRGATAATENHLPLAGGWRRIGEDLIGLSSIRARKHKGGDPRAHPNRIVRGFRLFKALIPGLLWG